MESDSDETPVHREDKLIDCGHDFKGQAQNSVFTY
jgi:hypothetical protein